MKAQWVLAAVALVGLSCAEVRERPVAVMRPVAEARAAEGGRSVESLDLDWRFARGDLLGAQEVGWDDRAWRRVDVPHDWSIEGPFEKTNATSWGGAYAPSGVAWYRKRLKIGSRGMRGERVFLDFDGVMANAEVWLNGKKLSGARPWGYLGFRCDATDAVRWDGENVLAVRTDTSAQPASRWYTGAGIYRHVWLVRTGAVHVEQWGVFVTTPEVSREGARVRANVRVENGLGEAARVRARVRLVGPDGRDVAVMESGEVEVVRGKIGEVVAEGRVERPELWGMEAPRMYRAVVELVTGERVVDRYEVPFGIREARFEAATGFWLNGENIKLKGVCLHHDAGGLGAAVPVSVWRKRLETLKRYGVNAVRTSHNPVAPEFLDLCDEMGVVVMDEAFDAWRRGKVPHDYSDLYEEHHVRDVTDMVRRDRNHPSVVIYSAGNEIHDVLYDPPLGVAVFRELVEVFHRADPTRPVTVAVNQPERSRIHETGFVEMEDVAGYNYREQYSVDGRKAAPGRKIIGTENAKSSTAWRVVRDNPDLAGMFLWTGYDYLGESVRRWPYLTFEFGMFDFSGNPRPVAEQFRAYWTKEPVVSVARLQGVTPLPSGTKVSADRLSDWNPPVRAGEVVNLEVYSNAAAVELFLNGRSLGTRLVPEDASPIKWPTVYEPGELRAVGKSAERGAAVCEARLRTSGRAERVEVSVDRERLPVDRAEVVYVSARLVDAAGVTVTDGDVGVRFEAEGPGELLATESGDLKSHESFQSARRNTFRGRCTAIYRATGPGRIRVRVSGEGVKGGAAEVEAVAGAVRELGAGR